MAQPDIPTCSSPKVKEFETEEVYSGGQKQCHASVKSWLIQTKRAFDATHKIRLVSKGVCIYRVPQLLSLSKPKAYAPSIISFGPYHKINSELSGMDQHKLEAVHIMLARLQIDVNQLIVEIKKLEPQIRECYEEPIDLDGEALSWMLAMDTCFILEFFRGGMDPNCFDLNLQKVELKYHLRHISILNDIIKLENQIPLFILIEVLALECGTPESAITQLAAMLSNFSVFHGSPFRVSWSDNYRSKLKYHMMTQRPYHLLDLYRIVVRDGLTDSDAKSATYFEIDGYGDVANTRHEWWMHVALRGWMQRFSCIDLPPCLPLKLRSDNSRSTPTAELLHKAGIKFQPGQLKFEKRMFGRGTLTLPEIQITDDTEVQLRNLMAYEECQTYLLSQERPVISHFVHLLNELIDTEKDVSVLRNSLVIQSWVNSDEDIAHMFNSICYGITFIGIEEIEKVMGEVRKNSNSNLNMLISEFKEEYCSKPRKFISIVAATLILGMTAVQTVYSVGK